MMSSVTAPTAVTAAQPLASATEAVLLNNLAQSSLLQQADLSAIQNVPQFTTELADPVLQEASYLYNPGPDEQLTLEGVFEIYNDISNEDGIAVAGDIPDISPDAVTAAYQNTPASAETSRLELQQELEAVGLPTTLTPISNPQQPFDTVQNFIDTLNTQLVVPIANTANANSDTTAATEETGAVTVQEAAQELAAEAQNLPEGTLIDLVA